MKLPPKPRRRTRLAFESLEDRSTPAAITVTTGFDLVDGDTTSIANLMATPGADGFVSLREAIQAANADAAFDTISFDASVTTVNLTQFDTGLDSDEAGPSAFKITTGMAIVGSGQVINRDVETSSFRHFYVTQGAYLSLQNLELSGGRAAGGDGFAGGGGAAGLGGSIFNNGGTVGLLGTTFTNNRAIGGNGSNVGEGAGGGGGLGQSASGVDGGGPNGGSDSGSGGFGGGGAAGFETNGGAGGFGGGGGGNAFGGIGGDGGFGGGGGGTSSVAGIGRFGGSGGFGAGDSAGTAGGGGAGLGGAVFNLAGTLWIANSTFANNFTIGGTNPNTSERGQGLGGGIFNLNGSVDIVNSTFHANQADAGGSLYNLSHFASQGIPLEQSASATLINSIFENSLSPDAIGSDSLPAAAGDEVHNILVVNPQTSGGAFLAQIDAKLPNITNGGGFVDDTGTLVFSGLVTETGTSLTGGLANNGGLTRTVAIAAGSGAENTGNTAAAVDPDSEDHLTTDQRGPGFLRLGGSSVDLGAYEIQTPPPLPTVNVVATSPTSREDGTNLQFQFTRTGDTSQELIFTVNYSLNGFTLGVDSSAEITEGGSITNQGTSAIVRFAAGSATITSTLVVEDDIHAEADESISGMIPQQAGIIVGQSSSATATILANDFVVINANDSGEGSLRQAIRNAESIGGADTITFIGSLAGATIRLSTFVNGAVGPTAFTITTDVTIQGTGQVISRDGEASDFRFFHVSDDGESRGSLTLENLEIQGGTARGGNGAGGGGGAAGLGGAIFNEGNLLIRNTTFVGNTAVGGNAATDSGGGGGGGLGGDGQPGPDGAGGGPNGGAGGFEGTGGSGGFGGGGGGDSQVDGGKIGGNGGFGGGGGGTSGGLGGNGGFGGGGGASLASGTPGFGVIPSSGEGADTHPEGGAGFGGAIFNYGGRVLLLNSTLTGNAAIGGTTTNDETSFTQPGYGGGLFNLNGSVEIRNSTFAANRSDVGGSIYNLAHDTTEGVNVSGDATVAAFNSIFVDSIKPVILVEGPAAPSDDEVHNLQLQISQQFSGGGFVARIDATPQNITNHGGFVNDGGTLNATGIIQATRPVVSGTLANNGGPVRTLALLRNSEAIDAGENDDAEDPSQGEGGEPFDFDQRGPGFPRILPLEGTVDLGAYEAAVAGIPDTIVITAPNFIVVQNGPEGGPTIQDPFPDFFGENLVAVGDVNRDGIVDFIFSAGNYGGPRVQVFSGADGSVLYNFFAYDRDFRGGVYIATGDLDGDGYSDVITGAGMLGGPHVRAFSGKDGSVIANFFAFDSGHRSGVTVAVGDVNGDGKLDIITGSGPGDGSEIRIFDGTKLGQPDAHFASLFPYEAGYRGGVFVAAGNLDGDQFADIVAGPLAPGGTTQTVVFTGKTLSKINSFFEDEPSLFVGIRFTIADANGDGIDDMVVVAAQGGGPRRIVVNPLTGEQIDNSFFDDPNVRSEGYGVG